MRFRCATALVVFWLVTALVAWKESVRGELSRLQKQTGLTLAWYYSSLNTVSFANRVTSADRRKPLPDKYYNALLSPDSMELAFPAPGPDPQPNLTIVRRDGTTIAQYPELLDATALCWSHDKSKLLVQARTAGTRPPQYHLFVLNLVSRAATQLGEEGSNASPQCWSPDDKMIAYSTKDDDVHLYDILSANSRSIAQGWEPAWSPDGQQIALWRKDGYYSISPASGQLKQLFKTKQGRSGLFWSPDSRFVAYLGEGGTFRETLRYLDVGLVQLRIRRLSDGSEDWVWQTPDVPPAHSLQFVWVTLSEAKN